MTYARALSTSSVATSHKPAFHSCPDGVELPFGGRIIHLASYMQFLNPKLRNDLHRIDVRQPRCSISVVKREGLAEMACATADSI